MRGLMSDPRGEIIDRPIRQTSVKASPFWNTLFQRMAYMQGLSDTALRTADSGYLTRRLVDVAQDVIVREIDCGTTDGVPTPLIDEKGKVDEQLISRCLAESVVNPTTGEVLKEARVHLFA